ncbi:MAG: RDD family protein [Blastocatellales bacterium]
MKCENCGIELVGAAIVCRHCNHNNAQGRVSQWRARRTGELPKPSTRSLSPLSSQPEPGAGKSGPLNSKPVEALRQTAIPFDSKIQINKYAAQSPDNRSIKAPAVEMPTDDDDNGVIQYPAWRAQLKEKVRQVRERNGAAAPALEAEPDEAQLDPNPIVESALKRIQWANHPPPISSLPRSARHGSSAVALAVDPDFDSESESISEIKPRVKSETTANPESQAKSVSGTTSNPLLGHHPAKPGEHTVTKSLSPRQEPTAKIPVKDEVRIDLPPASKPTTNPFAVPKPATPKVRTTGEIKRPQPAARTQPPPSVTQNSATTAIPPSHPVETQVIGLSPSVSTVTGYVNVGAATRHRPRTAPLWVRTLAGACDSELIAMAYLPMFASFAELKTSVGSESLALMFLLLATLTFCYQILTLTLADRTSGMALLQLQLINIADAEAQVSRSQILTRAAAATAAFLCPPLNFIVMQSNQHRYSLPDLFSGTTLVERSSLR